MADTDILKRILLGPKHHVTEKTRHYSGGELLGPPSELRIVQFVDDPGYYLLYYDSHGQEMADTYHQTFEEAMAQADFEFEVKPSEWQDVADL